MAAPELEARGWYQTLHQQLSAQLAQHRIPAHTAHAAHDWHQQGSRQGTTRRQTRAHRYGGPANARCSPQLTAHHLATSTIDDNEDTTMTAPAARCARGPISMITLVSRSIVSRTAAGSSGSARLGHTTQLNGQHSQHSHHQAPTAIRQPPKAQRSATWRGAMAGPQLAAGRRWPGAARRGAT